MPTENKQAEPFQREDRYIALKLKRLPNDEAEYLRDCHAKAMVDCVVVERDWPEYNLVWAMIEHRMAGKPVPDFNLWRRANELQERLNAADQRIDELMNQAQPEADDALVLIIDHQQFIAGEYEDLIDKASDFQDRAYALGIARGIVRGAASNTPQ